jgi:hypothetical protein
LRPSIAFIWLYRSRTVRVSLKPRGAEIAVPSETYAFLTWVTALTVLLALFDLAALRWGTDSRDPIDSPEYSRRRDWPI